MKQIFHWLATAMVGGGMIGAGHGFTAEYRYYQKDVLPEYRTTEMLLARAVPTAASHGLVGMLLTPIAPVLLTHKLMIPHSWSPCPTVRTLKSLLE